MKKATTDQDLIFRVRLALAAVPNVTEKRMFGSVGFMVRGNLCVSAREGRIMCRIDPANHGSAIRRKGCRTVVMRGRPMQGYVYVDGEAIKTGSALSYWLKQALEYNRTLDAKSK